MIIGLGIEVSKKCPSVTKIRISRKYVTPYTCHRNMSYYIYLKTMNMFYMLSFDVDQCFGPLMFIWLIEVRWGMGVGSWLGGWFGWGVWGPDNYIKST